ncbi:MAG: EamA family transporter [Armatimonadetes bacterium]|nr:EamA family transporter [Armatimonadota bacterium]
MDYLHIFTSPVVLLGLCCYAANLFLYLFVISRARLGFAYPLIALNYALVSVLAWRFFDEPISRQQSVGLAIIILGVVVFATQPEPAKAHAVEPAAEQSLASPAGR